jgi:arginyl-tRNA synthetase
LLKSDGSYTYFASDIAYHADKYRRGFAQQIDVWGADHGGYVKRMQAAVKAVSDNKAELDVKLVQLVRLFRNGEPFKMSKRAGEFVTLRDVVDEVGVDAVRFMMVFRKNDAVLDFDFAKVMEQSRDNPVFYVQYAHARGHSTFRKAVDAFGADILDGLADETLLARLTDEGERGLIHQIAQFPRVVEAAALAHEPHRIGFYAHELASQLHSHWNKGKDQPELRFVVEGERELTRARLALVKGVAHIIERCLALLGVSAPQEMR